MKALGDESMLRLALMPELRLQRGHPELQNHARDDGVDRQQRRLERRKNLAHRNLIRDINCL
jgi:hypothetical protein